MDARTSTAEARISELQIQLTTPPSPLGAYVESVQTGNLLYLSGMLPNVGRELKFLGRIGAELDMHQGCEAAHLATLNVLAAAKKHLGSLDRVTRVVKLAVYLATAPDFTAHPKVADAASELLRDVFGPESLPVRMVFGVATLPLGMPVEVEVILEVRP
jgi:enamine deaminase RidA (YjgF/YER057c/UK114 family)